MASDSERTENSEQRGEKGAALATDGAAENMAIDEAAAGEGNKAELRTSKPKAAQDGGATDSAGGMTAPGTGATAAPAAPPSVPLIAVDIESGAKRACCCRGPPSARPPARPVPPRSRRRAQQPPSLLTPPSFRPAARAPLSQGRSTCTPAALSATT